MASRVYQFKIVLKNISPPIWRRLQVPDDYTFWDLHVAIQDAMGWSDCHLHCFEFAQPGERVGTRIGIPYEDAPEWGDPMFPGWKVKIAEWFKSEGDKGNYDYDFGDSWQHRIELEKILPAERKAQYPRCIGGRRACPPEDCGGPWGYADLLKIIKNPRHRRHKEIMEWLGGPLDPEDFEADKIYFDNPQQRLKEMLKQSR